MITLNEVSTICNTLAVGQGKNPLVDGFEVNLFLPFPFFDGLQREISQLAFEAVGTEKIDPTQSMKFMEIRFPSGVLVHVHPSEKNVVFEPVTKDLKVVHINKQGGFLKPGGQRT